MNPFSILSAAVGIGQGVGTGIAGLVKRLKKDDEPKPQAQPLSIDPMDLLGDAQQVSQQVLPSPAVIQGYTPTPANPTLPGASQLQPVPSAAAQPQPLPYQRARDNYLMQAMLRNQG